MKKTLSIISVLLFTTTVALAQKETGTLGFSVGLGTTGITIDAAFMPIDYIGIRAGVDLLSEVSYKHKVDVRNANSYQELVDLGAGYLGVPTVNVPKEVKLEGKLKNDGTHLLVDVYPGRKTGFHVTLGAYLSHEKVMRVTTLNDDDLKGVYTFNRFCDQYATVIPGYDLRNYKIGAQLGDYFLEPDENGHVEGDIRVNKFRPYVGIGWGRAVPNKRIGVSVDLGCQLWGKPEIWAQDKKLQKDDFKGQDGGAVETISKISVWPVITVRLRGKIF